MKKAQETTRSNYTLRTAYLRELKEFMAAGTGTSTDVQTKKAIDAYLGYEKMMSSQLHNLRDRETPSTP